MRESHAVRLALGSMGAAARWVRGRPFIVNHLLTVRCNLQCPFCYVAGPEQRAYNQERYPRSAELTTAEVRRFYGQLVEEGFRLAVLLGGEPLLREDLDACLEVLEGRLWTTVFTNGFLLEQRHALVRRANNLFVSLDAPDEQHDALRAQPGTFRRALAGIERVRSLYPRLAVTLNMTVTEANVGRVGDMLRLGRELKLPVAFQPPTYEGLFALDDRPETKAATLTPDPEAVGRAFAQIREAAARGERIIGSTAFFSHVVENQRTYPCHYPTYVLGPVQPNGDVVGCIDSKVIDSVRQRSVREVISGPAFRSHAARGPGCPTGCRDWGIYDLSALKERSIGAGELRRYGRMFLRGLQPKAALWLAGHLLQRAEHRARVG